MFNLLRAYFKKQENCWECEEPITGKLKFVDVDATDEIIKVVLC